MRIGGAVAAVQRHAAVAGAEILAAGGNAADAAVAVAFAQGVVDPYRCGIGGGGMALVRTPDGAVSTLEFYGVAPERATADMFTAVGHWGTLFQVEGQRNQFGYQASIVPGLVRGLGTLFEKHGSGSVSWADVLAPAIRLAEEGFPGYPYFVRQMHQHSDHPFLGVTQKTVTYGEPARAVFARDGRLPVLGETFRQPDYGATLRRIAEAGPDEFYTGETAERIAADFAANGGLLSAADLAAYRARELTPLSAMFRGHRVVTENAPSVGPTFLQLLRVLDGWPDGPRWNGADYLDRLVRSINLVFQDRHQFIGDPDHIDVPLDMLLSDERAAAHRSTVESGKPLPPSGASSNGSHDTTHTTVLDHAGLAVLVTHSIGSGSGVVTPGLGFLQNNHMIQFDPRPGHPNSIAAHKLPNIGGSPSLTFDPSGELVLAMGSPGGGLKATAMAQILANILDHGMSPAEAVAADRVHAEDVPLYVAVDPRFEPAAVVELARRGYEVDFSEYGARIAAVARQPGSGVLTPIADPRGDRGVATVPSTVEG